MVELTEGVIEKIFLGEKVPNPILQITNVKKIEATGTGPLRYRITLNDGKYSTNSAILSSQKHDSVDSGELKQYTVVQLVDYVCNDVQNRRLIIMLDMSIVKRAEEVKYELGCATQLDATQYHSANRTAGSKPLAVAQPEQKTQNGSQRPAAAPTSVAVSHNTSSSATGGTVFPISSLTPYQNKWCVRVRVTKKHPIRTYSNSRGEGKLFSLDLADESGEMRATGFNQECDKYYDFIKEKGVYYIKGGQIRSANRQFTSIVNDYELMFSSDTTVEPCLDDNIYQLPTATFNFVKFDKLPACPRDRVIDVIGVVDSVSTIQNLVQRKTNAELKKRDIRLIDDSCNSVTLTLWGQEAESFEPEDHPIVAIKGVRISDFNGLSLSASASSQFHLNPDLPEAHRLKGWYNSKGGEVNVNFLSTASKEFGGRVKYTHLALATADRLGTGDKPDYFSCKAFITSVKKDNCLYKACPAPECNKKVIDHTNSGRYRCDRCMKEYDSFKYRLMMRVTLTDFTIAQEVTLFNEQAEQVLAVSAQELADIRERNEEEYLLQFDKPLFHQFNFRLCAKQENYNDELRVKVTCNRCEAVNMQDYNKYLMDDIQKMQSMPSTE